MKKINQTNLKRRISLMLLITIFLMSSLVVGCGKKNVNTVSTKEDALVEETEESEKIEQETEIVQTENEEKKNLGTFVLYFSGIDVWGWTDTKSRSDVNIIAAVNTETRHVQLINTPRDYFVEMPISNGAKDKLTHAGLYGVENSVGTLEKLYDVDIDYYLRVNFSGFEAPRHSQHRKKGHVRPAESGRGHHQPPRRRYHRHDEGRAGRSDPGGRHPSPADRRDPADLHRSGGHGVRPAHS